MLKILSKSYLIRTWDLITSLLKDEPLADNFMRIVCLEQNTENSFLSELKKTEVSSYRVLCVLHMDCTYKKSLLSSINRQLKLKSEKVAEELIKGPQLSSSFFIMKSVSCSTIL